MAKGIKIALSLGDSEFLKGVNMVPSGVVRIAELQKEGFSYLKAD